MTRRIFQTTSLAIALLLAGPAGATFAAGAAPAASGAAQPFENAKFSFAFGYDAGWIPSVQTEGESVTFALSEGEVHIAAQRDPNPKHVKTRQDLADDAIASWKKREGLVFSVLERKESTLGNLPATRIEGTAKEYDEEYPYKLEQYVVEKDGRLYVVKYSGLYDPSQPYWEGFQRLVRSFKFRDGSATASAGGTATPAATRSPAKPRPTATPTAAPAPTVPERSEE
jgi:hypothetical protein